MSFWKRDESIYLINEKDYGNFKPGSKNENNIYGEEIAFCIYYWYRCSVEIRDLIYEHCKEMKIIQYKDLEYKVYVPKETSFTINFDSVSQPYENSNSTIIHPRGIWWFNITDDRMIVCDRHEKTVSSGVEIYLAPKGYVSYLLETYGSESPGEGDGEDPGEPGKRVFRVDYPVAPTLVNEFLSYQDLNEDSMIYGFDFIIKDAGEIPIPLLMQIHLSPMFQEVTANAMAGKYLLGPPAPVSEGEDSSSGTVTII